MWFNQEKKKKMEFVQSFVPTSKAQLLQVAMYFSGGDTKKAQEFFDFYNKNLNLPDFEPVAPTWKENTANAVNGIIAWLKENQDTLAQGYSFIQSVVANRGILPSVATAAEETVEALPEINGELNG